MRLVARQCHKFSDQLRQLSTIIGQCEMKQNSTLQEDAKILPVAGNFAISIT